jgi:hypothetical protein
LLQTATIFLLFFYDSEKLALETKVAAQKYRALSNFCSKMSQTEKHRPVAAEVGAIRFLYTCETKKAGPFIGQLLVK